MTAPEDALGGPDARPAGAQTQRSARFLAATHGSDSDPARPPLQRDECDASQALLDLPLVMTERYALAGEIARGGLGSVSLAHDRALDRGVALKQPIRTTQVNHARFVREIRFTARLQHPGIVPIYDAGRWLDGVPFYAMKLVRGRTLAEAVERAATLERRLALLPAFQALVDAMAYAHDQGVIHRDIKPQNVLVGDFGETVLIDWGVAKDLRTEPPRAPDEMDATLEAELTAAGAIVGTPAYMPPEQARGERLDERADVYALGATLYHLLAGGPPLRGGVGTTIDSLRREAPVQPLLERAPGVPTDLAAIVAKAMATAPRDRYPSARELAGDVLKFTTGQLIGARRYSRRELLLRWVRRRYRALVIAAVAAATLVVAVVGVLAERNEARAARAVAETRSDALTLAQARTALRDDPTEAIAWLASYPLSGADWRQVFSLAQSADSLGVARHVLVLSQRDCSGLAFTPDGRTLLVNALYGLELRSVASGARTRFMAGVERAAPLADSAALVVTDAHGELSRVSLHDGARRRLADVQGPVTALAVAPDDSFAAVGLADGRLAAVALAGGDVTELARHAGAVTAVHVEADGDHIISVAADGALRRTSRRAGEGVALAQGAAELRQLAVATDGRTVAFADTSGAVFAADLGAPPEDLAWSRARFRLPTAITGLAIAADGRHLAASDAEGQLRVHDLVGDRERTQPWPGLSVFGLRFAPHEPVLAVTGRDGSVHAWNLDTDTTATRFGDRTTYDAPVFAPDGREVVTCSMNGSARVWELHELRGRVMRGHRDQVGHALFLPDGRLVTDSFDHSVRVWDPDTGAAQVLTGHRELVYGLAYGADGLLATAGFDGARLWDLATGASIALQGHDGRVRAVAFLPGDGGLVTAGQDGDLRVWARDGRPIRTLRGHVGPVAWVAVAADASIVSTGADGTLRRWSLTDASGTILGEGLNIPNDPNFRPALLAGGRVATCHGSQALAVWRLTGGEPQVFPVDVPLYCTRLVASPDGRTLAIPAQREILVLDADTGRWRQLGSHDEEVQSLRFSPDGRLLASASHDRTARVWRWTDGAAAILRRGDTAVLGVDFAPDGRALAATGVDGTVWVGPIDEARFVPPEPAALRARLLARTTARLVPEGGVVSADDP